MAWLNQQRNPWHGTGNTTKEFLYDLRYPAQWLQRAIEGLRTDRMAGAVVGVGVLNVLIGLVLVLH